jgi:3',5'-cyclic AMP phosphodiesterase CpdA
VSRRGRCTAALLATIAALALGLLAPAAGAVVAFAAGDIADCGRDDPARSAAAATARLVPDGAAVLVLGDAVYPLADRATLERCYGPSWGRLRATTYAVPGNHDYVRGSARDFLAYFGAHEPPRTYFREALGDWWVIGLDSNLGGERLAQQARWLEHELAAIRGDGRCLLALWHHAFLSSGLHRGDGERMRPAWEALADAGADLVLSGHEHFYEAFEPHDRSGRPAAAGIREFVVGTGGARLVDFSMSGGHRAYARVHGVLELELDRDRYRWRFRTVDGEVRDAGAAPCRRPGQPAGPSEAASRETSAAR